MSLVDSADGVRAVVAVKVAASCPRCASGKGCGAGIFAASGNAAQPVEASVRKGLDLSEGDVVEISLAPDNLLQAAIIVYGLPMLGAIAGATLAYALSLRDSVAAMAALTGMAAGLVVSRWRVRQTSCLRNFVPVVKRRVPESGAGLE
ncbi:MAG: SoxR reducing system RseC family protein [Gammaproteobacteria bacterium]|nr:SoxR reducing system RseC family protein [Gammaproteobacteria bacterium]MDH3417761.1 SoxR reducing system RseC family protein [Gammaproteobacteria bacterium]